MKLIREHNEFDWFDEVSGYHENITNMDGLRFIIVGRNNVDWQVFRGWIHTYPVTGVTTHKGLLCYIVKLSETLDVYVPVEDVMDRERKNIDESTDDFNFDDGLNWVREIPISVSFEEAIIGRRYRIEPTEVLRDAIFECDDEEWMINSKVVDVMAKEMLSYGDIHCGNINQDKVLSLRLKFWGPNYETENNFWVTPNMVDLYEMDGFLNEEEENPFQWIEDIPANVTFEMAEVGRTYRIEPTEVLKDALEACGSPSWINYSRKAKVVLKGESEYRSVYCDHERDDLVPTLRLDFYYREFEKGFWVTEDMVTLYEMDGVMTESEENPLQWIIDEPIGIELQPNTLYYFKPHLTLDEIKVFANGITNSGHIKDFLLRTVLDRVYQKGPNGGLKYFVTGDNVNDGVVGWCTGTPVEQSVLFYANLNQVDVRKEFGL
jgi:hypothetical protein